MIADRTTDERPTKLDETSKAAATPAAGPSAPDKSTDGAMELNDEQALAIGGGLAFQKITWTD